ncbi:long-chain fatty acid--CoA ligase [Ramlibacter tataouinensis]|uniref:acyl-CoA synthetase n=1 Tax=Ramlibacter tataouinensis TaxID=94132 RepID=UPI0022F3954D|nr:long-chain fatty acid--CoA ligase [Ramlibacter tataouinensis]WBY03049.1 long-chain fatty acid--CoA ligase [Ramlibacter tataouinensis]
MQLTQALTRAVQTRATSTATIYKDRKRSWKEVGERVPRLAAGLRGLGLKPGDRLAVLAFNSDNYIELFFAAAWANLVLVPLNTRWAVPENLYSLRDAECSGLLLDDAFAPQGAELLAGHPMAHVVHMGDAPTPPGMHAYEALIAGSKPMPDECGRNDELCGICYTGGTTGDPKGVMLSHTNFITASINWIATLHFSDQTVYLHSAGLFHLAGSSPAFALTLAGGTHVCLPKFDAVLAFEAIQKHRINYVLFVPTMINMMLNHPDFDKYDLTSVRYCEYGASPMPDAVLAAAIEKLPTWEFIQGYGMTETAALTVSLPWRYHFDGEHGKAKRQAAGRASYGVDVRIVDEEGREVPRGTPGEIAVRGAQVMLGYWKKPEATAAAIRNGWMHTGDGAWMDEDGFIYIVDRVKDMIISGGENIYSKEVENAVHAHPSVRECAVIGVPDEKWGEAVLAVVALKDGKTATAEEIIAHCHKLIANYKCPRQVAFVDALPLSGAGKVLKNVLRDPYWKGKKRSVN